jgi:hypothetical protein
MTAILSLFDKRWPKLPPECVPQEEICVEMEAYLRPCECGGAFKKGTSPRCPRCNTPLSAETATSYIEENAPGTNKGWRWQENWHETYCIVIENIMAEDKFKTWKSLTGISSSITPSTPKT